jgi:hypothetical protein
MTDDELKKECTVMWLKIYDSSTTREHDVESLMALCKRQQAVGLREIANEMRESGNDRLGGWIEWCENKAKEREG